mmetsp:Transcript_106420/g.208687  ORF Transcript_106420/g.208687 Transcript_106420/m.208687 type:complete len:119 (+) Transcript_106420:602-958(+)
MESRLVTDACEYHVFFTCPESSSRADLDLLVGRDGVCRLLVIRILIRFVSGMTSLLPSRGATCFFRGFLLSIAEDAEWARGRGCRLESAKALDSISSVSAEMEIDRRKNRPEFSRFSE